MKVISGSVIANCPVRNVLAQVGDRWSLLILHALWERRAAMRFMELQRAIPDISHCVLPATFRRLHEDGAVPLNVEYLLTPIALSFLREISYVVE